MTGVTRLHSIYSYFNEISIRSYKFRNHRSYKFDNSYITFRFFQYLISQYRLTILFDKLFGCIIRKVRSLTEYLQAVCRGPRNCINFSNKTESYKFAAGNIVRESSVPHRGVINFGSHETIRVSSKSFPHFRKPMRKTSPRNSRPVFAPITSRNLITILSCLDIAKDPLIQLRVCIYQRSIRQKLCNYITKSICAL